MLSASRPPPRPSREPQRGDVALRLRAGRRRAAGRRRTALCASAGRRRRSARPAESVVSALRITRVMRSGPCAGATRSWSRTPALRPGPRASRADLDITGHYVSSAGPAALKGSASRCGSDAESGAHRVAGAGDERRRANRMRGACAGDTVLGRGDGRYGAGRRLPTRPHAERLGRVWPRPTRGLIASEPPPPVGSGTGGTKENAIRWATCKQR